MTSFEESDGPTAELTQVGPESGERGPESSVERRLRLLLVGVFTALAVVMVVLLLARGSGESDVGPVGHHLGVGPSWDEIAAQVPLKPGRRYSDEELGLYELIDKIVFHRPYFARARNLEDFMEHRDQRWNRMMHEASGHERERLRFEFDIEGALLTAYNFSPDDLGEEGPLEDAYYGWLVKCVSPAGFPEVVVDPDTKNELPIYLAEEEQLMHYESESGFSRDEFYDLRYKCALQAATYPTLDTEMRDEMIGRMKRHYLRSIYDGLCLGRPTEVPVVAADPDAVRTVPSGAPRSPRDCGVEWSEWYGIETELKDPHEFTPWDLAEDRRAVRELSVAGLLRQVGVLKFVLRYIANLPLDNVGLAADELSRSVGVVLYDLAAAEYDGDTAARELHEFENLVLGAAFGASHSGGVDLLTSSLIDDLYSAFYRTLDACGRRTGGPDVEMFRSGARGLVFDPARDLSTHELILSAVPDLPHAMSYYEHLEVLHECALYAAAYPTVDPAVRDELLAPQRAYFARTMLDRIDDEFLPAEIPHRYRNDVEELRQSGW